ncbi:hypothetical protein ACQP1O_36385 [Nocardia sp. CA-151230]|uniref:hypothetical protein n=1 Tax=Nocardia sp. CA-151230 TaxID=3239982 RepID=UPI003D8F9AED
MTPAVASLIATTLALAIAAVAAVWLAVPWLRRHAVAVAITACLWVHVFRIVALQIYSARRVGFEIPLSAAHQIAWGDVLGAGLAFLGIWLLRRDSRAAIPVLWLFIAETVLDLANGTVLGIRYDATTTAHDLTWVILNFYVPVLWVSLMLVAWQLVARRREFPTVEAEFPAR